jgi:hypothetical protein
MRVRVYRNLNNGLISCQTKVDGGWRVVGYLPSVALQNCKMIVQQSGYLRTIKDKQRNVHAMIEGDLCTLPSLPPRSLRYNPFIAGHFFDADTHEAIETAAVVYIESHGKKGAPCPIWFE